jgi:aminoglycoside phosphotransferase (APT) family kinase protein
MIPEVATLDDRDHSLPHGDLHLGNILFEVTDGSVTCVGFLDLEGSHVGASRRRLAPSEEKRAKEESCPD